MRGGRLDVWIDAEDRWTAYPAVRRVMGPERETINDEILEDILAEMFPGAEPEDVEDFMRTLQKIGKQVAPIAQKALPGMIQGAVQGGMVAGPWGALAGAAIGGAGSVLAGGGSKRPTPQRPRAAAPAPTAPPTAPTIPTAPTTAPVATLVRTDRPNAAIPGATGNPATAQLLALLSRPETMQALQALLMAQRGRSTVAVGQTRVPPAAFANAVAELAAQAADEAGPAEGLAEYLIDAEGNLRCDVVNPAERAAVLVGDLAALAAAEAVDDASLDELEEVLVDVVDDALAHDDEVIEVEDPMEGYEAALEGRSGYVD